MDIVAHLVVVDELAVDSVEHKFLVQFDAEWTERYPYYKDPLLQMITWRLLSSDFDNFLSVREMDLE